MNFLMYWVKGFGKIMLISLVIMMYFGVYFLLGWIGFLIIVAMTIIFWLKDLNGGKLY